MRGDARAGCRCCALGQHEVVPARRRLDPLRELVEPRPRLRAAGSQSARRRARVGARPRRRRARMPVGRDLECAASRSTSPFSAGGPRPRARATARRCSAALGRGDSSRTTGAAQGQRLAAGDEQRPGEPSTNEAAARARSPSAFQLEQEQRPPRTASRSQRRASASRSEAAAGTSAPSSAATRNARDAQPAAAIARAALPAVAAECTRRASPAGSGRARRDSRRRGLGARRKLRRDRPARAAAAGPGRRRPRGGGGRARPRAAGSRPGSRLRPPRRAASAGAGARPERRPVGVRQQGEGKAEAGSAPPGAGRAERVELGPAQRRRMSRSNGESPNPAASASSAGGAGIASPAARSSAAASSDGAPSIAAASAASAAARWRWLAACQSSPASPPGSSKGRRPSGRRAGCRRRRPGAGQCSPGAILHGEGDLVGVGGSARPEARARRRRPARAGSAGARRAGGRPIPGRTPTGGAGDGDHREELGPRLRAGCRRPAVGPGPLRDDATFERDARMRRRRDAEVDPAPRAGTPHACAQPRPSATTVEARLALQAGRGPIASEARRRDRMRVRSPTQRSYPARLGALGAGGGSGSGTTGHPEVGAHRALSDGERARAVRSRLDQDDRDVVGGRQPVRALKKDVQSLDISSRSARWGVIRTRSTCSPRSLPTRRTRVAGVARRPPAHVLDLVAPEDRMVVEAPHRAPSSRCATSVASSPKTVTR